MPLERLDLFDFRNIRRSSLVLGDCNFFYGANASGKTSVLESLYMLGHLGSFRSARRPDVLISKDQLLFGLRFGMTDKSLFSLERLRGERFRIKQNKIPLSSESYMAQAPLVMVFSPHVESLITAPPKWRRAQIDAFMFHMKQSYAQDLANYDYILAQRNMLLKEQKLDETLGFWTDRLIAQSTLINEARLPYVEAILDATRMLINASGLEVDFSFYPGWSGEDIVSAFAKVKTNESLRRQTLVGAHLANIIMTVEGEQACDRLSRGQIKLVQLAFLAAQLLVAPEDKSKLFLVDDAHAEIDESNAAFLSDWIAQTDAQVFLTTIKRQDAHTIARKMCLEKQPCFFYIKEGKIEAEQEKVYAK